MIVVLIAMIAPKDRVDVATKIVQCFLTPISIVFHGILKNDLESKEQHVSNWRIERAVAVGIASVVAIDAAPALYVEILSNRRPVEQIASNDLTPTDTFLALGALSGLTTVTPAFSSRSKVAGGGAYTGHRRLNGLAPNNGPDEYFSPRYRNGKCVEDEGNTLMAERAFGSGVWRMEGKSLERGLASLCRKAAL
jgi:hypothetical protein